MKHILRIFGHTVGILSYFILIGIAWVIQNVLTILWTFNTKNCEPLSKLGPIDKLPDGKEVYCVIEKYKYKPAHGMFVKYKVVYYEKWIDAIRNNKKTEKRIVKIKGA